MPKPLDIEFLVGVREDEEGDMAASMDPREISRTGVCTSSVSAESPLLSADIMLSRVKSESLILLAMGIGGTSFCLRYDSSSAVSVMLADLSCVPRLFVLFLRRSWTSPCESWFFSAACVKMPPAMAPAAASRARWLLFPDRLFPPSSSR